MLKVTTKCTMPRRSLIRMFHLSWCTDDDQISIQSEFSVSVDRAGGGGGVKQFADLCRVSLNLWDTRQAHNKAINSIII